MSGVHQPHLCTLGIWRNGLKKCRSKLLSRLKKRFISAVYKYKFSQNYTQKGDKFWSFLLWCRPTLRVAHRNWWFHQMLRTCEHHNKRPLKYLAVHRILKPLPASSMWLITPKTNFVSHHAIPCYTHELTTQTPTKPCLQHEAVIKCPHKSWEW